MAKFAVQANKAAKNLSATTNEFAKASLIYFQQGDPTEVVLEKAAVT
jgi:type 1 glutamine amidotransferase